MYKVLLFLSLFCTVADEKHIFWFLLLREKNGDKTIILLSFAGPQDIVYFFYFLERHAINHVAEMTGQTAKERGCLVLWTKF